MSFYEKHFFARNLSTLFSLDKMKKNKKGKINFTMRKKYAHAYFKKHFCGCHFKTSNQIKNITIDHIYIMHVVRSDKVTTIRSVWKKTTRFL